MNNVMKNKTGKRNESKSKMKKAAWRNQALLLLVLALVMGLALQAPALVTAADVSCKTLCKAALQGTGGSSKLKFQSAKSEDFGGFSVSEREKVSSIMYLCDEKEVYSICVVKAAGRSDASDILKSFKAYKSNNSSSDYLSDYSSSEQKVFKNAVCGKSGKYVWYIAMSASKSTNKKGQAELKKKL